MFKINTEKELLELLKIISEEAVGISKKSLNEVDSAQSEYMRSLKRDEALYGNLREQEVAEEEVPEEDEVAAEEEVPADDEIPEEEVEEVPEETPPPSEEFGVSFDSVVTDINTLRSGRSLKNTEIRDELVAYYDRLDDNERKALHLFLRELSKILRGAIDGAEAQDPSDPPVNLTITLGDEEPVEDEVAAEEEVPAEEEAPEEEAPEEEEEDTTPPIRVDERQDLREIRRKIRRLMRG